ncbi:hypothetical protein F511_08926 [Dorcoceras hygrometricum]|uniref:shikimate kinase n=1 Tax=Dorcoceras hygrometricum TaxID=472368 RepID=A0A2Z7AVQ0_9LAMI|nr:hypothetical protein F511_08926 [Dorcoceras hygrometricum]
MSVFISSNSLFFLLHKSSPSKSNFLIRPTKCWVQASSSAAPGIDISKLESAIAKKDSDEVKKALDQLSEIGWAKRWSSQPYVSRRTTSLRELTSLGIKNAENLAIPSVRNDAAFLFTVVGTTGLLGIIAGQILPGDWGFFVPYLIGSISLVVLAIGSISPGLLQAAIGGFSSFFPDYQERIARHEAAHFLVAYLLGLPILGYSLDIGKENVNLIDERLEKLIYSGQLDAQELDRLAVVAMAGLAAEGLQYDKVIGQSADLFTLQRFINRSKPQLSKDQQQNLTRWANKSEGIEPYLNGRCIFLVGMMGSGKTTVGKVLSEGLGYSFCDCDTLIEQAAGGSTVAEIFKMYGESFFRDSETEALEKLSSMHRLVVSTGGGAVIRPINWRYMQQGISVWLDVPLDALARRIAAVGTDSRPLLEQESGDPYSKDLFGFTILLLLLLSIKFRSPIYLTTDNGSPLKMHCTSKNNDLGNHTLYATNGFH